MLKGIALDGSVEAARRETFDLATAKVAERWRRYDLVRSESIVTRRIDVENCLCKVNVYPK